MDTFLLATKLRVPPQPHRTIHRQRLVDTLERGIPQHKLSLISAPPGYGKTTLLVQWAHGSSILVAWLSISEEDNDLERFLQYLMAAWEQVQPGIRESSLGMLLSTTSPDLAAVLSAFVNLASSASDPVVFVLDDYHLIEEPTVHNALIFLLDHLPPTFHFVLSSRAEPSFSLARYRVRDELLELHAEDLQFLPDEATDFLNSQMQLDLPQDEVAMLQAQLEGWIAGLQLVALTRKRGLVSTEMLAVSGKHRFIADYLKEEVLAPLSENTQAFLLQTSILDRLCGSLCDAVTGKNGSQEMLETLERENLFLVPLDDSRQWFRYHRLFVDVLSEQLHHNHADEVPDLHRRAARWYLTHEQAEPAFRHALEGDDVELIIQIFERYLFAKIFGGELKVATRWLDALPEEWYSSYVTLGIDRAAFYVAIGALDIGLRYLEEIEHHIQGGETEDSRVQLARVTAVRCFVACFQTDLERAKAFADQALRELPESDLSFRADIFHALGDTYRHHGRWEEARQNYLNTLDLDYSPVSRFRSVHVFGALADLELRRGRLRDSAAYWKKALAVIEERTTWGSFPLPLIGWVYIRLSEILYEWNQLGEASDYVSRGLERAELGGDVRARIAGYLIAGRIKLTEGDHHTAEAYLERARPLVEGAQFVHWISRFERFQLELWLEQDKLRAAVDWSDARLRDALTDVRPEHDVAQLAIARVLIIKGDIPSLDQAVTLVDHLMTMAEAEGRMGVTIEALILQALAHSRRRESVAAMQPLERALRLAEPEDYIRLFIDYGLPMARLLQEARSRAVLPKYVQKLLTAFDTDSELPMKKVLPEPLTQREQEILGLVAAGLTNEEIADELVISPETVKKHTSNIYGKLSVSNRTEAAARARELGLLD